MPMHRIVEVRRLHHVVLLVAAHAVLRAERGADPDVAERHQRVERMRQVARDRSRMGEQRDTRAFERRTQGRLFEKAVDAEFHRANAAGSSSAKQSE